jgi:hypothetical protein
VKGLAISAAVVVTVAGLSIGPRSVHASPTFTVTAEDTGYAPWTPCSNGPTQTFLGFMSNTGGDWVNFDVMTAGAGNDVPTLELYLRHVQRRSVVVHGNWGRGD